MFRITTLNKPCSQVSVKELCKQMSPLSSQGIDLLCCQSVAHASSTRLNAPNDETDQLAKHLRLTCSCFAADRQQDNESTQDMIELRGQAIFTGPGIWMLNSGSFVIGEGDCEEVVLFALVRKNGTSVLVFNFHLADAPGKQEHQLNSLFQHNLLKELYGAVMLCSDRTPMISNKKWLNISAPSSYTPFQLESNDNGLLSVFHPKNSSLSNHPLDLDRPTPGLSLSVEIKRTVKSKRSRPSFPLSFREQWLGYRDNRAFA